MKAPKLLALLLALLMVGMGAMSTQAQPSENGESEKGQGRDQDAREKDNSKADAESENGTSNGTAKGRDKDRDHPQNRTPQGRALGHDLDWHACRDAAGNNTTAKKECHDEAMQRAIERHQAIKAARAEGRVGGEINITADNETIDADEELDITVDRERDQGALKVTVGAELGRGKTIVLAIDPEMFDEDGNLTLRYWDVADDGSETENLTFTPADSLQDVLDPDDDEGAEYWVIKDHQGIHAMVSIDSWSVHAVTIQSEDAQTATSNLPGIVLGVLGTIFVVMGAVLWWNRPGRKD